MESLGSGHVRPETVLCSSPKWLSGKSVLSVTDDEFCSTPDHGRTIEIIKVNCTYFWLKLVVVTCMHLQRYVTKVELFDDKYVVPK